MLRSFDNLDRESARATTRSLALLAVIELASGPSRAARRSSSSRRACRSRRALGAARLRHRRRQPRQRHGLRRRRSRPARERARPSTCRRSCKTFADERLHQLASGADRTEQPLTMGFERVEDTLRLDSRTGPGAARRGHRRLSRRGIERPVGGVPADRRGQSVPLPAHLLAERTRRSTASSGRST